MTTIRLLSVEPDRSVADELRAVLSEEYPKVSVLSVPTLDAARERLAEETIDCVVTEHDLPDGDSLAVLDAARGVDPGVPVILYTDHGASGLAREALDAGVTDYVEKQARAEGHVVLGNRIETAVTRRRTEGTLHGNETEPRSLAGDALDTSEIATFILDDEFHVVWINRAVERYFDVDREEVVGRDKRRLVREEIADRFDEPDLFAERVLATYDDNTGVETFECHVSAGDGREDRWLEHWSQPIDSGHYTGGRIEQYTDVTERKRRQRTLEKATRRFDAVFEDPFSLIGIVEPDGTILHANRTALELAGVTGAEIEGEPFHETVWWQRSTESPERIQAAIDRAAAGEFVRFEAEYAHEGEHLVMDVAFRPVTDDSGEVVSLIAEAKDITERKRLRSDLREERGLFERVAETSPVGIVSVDPNGDVTFINARGEEILDRTREEINDASDRASAFELTDEDGAPVGPEETPSRRVVETDEPVYNAEYTLERPGDERVWLSINGAPLRDETGEITDVVLTFEDVTDRKQRERQLRESEAHVRALFENSPDAIFLHDERGRIIDANQQACDSLGYTREGLVGSEIQDVERSADPAELDDIWDEIEFGETLHFDGIHRRKDGSEFPVEIRVNAIDRHDEVQYLAVARDVTERKQHEAQLVALDELSRELLEAKTPQKVCDSALATAETVLDLPIVVIALYDTDDGVLRPVARTPDAEALVGPARLDHTAGLEWRAFVEDEPRTYGDQESAFALARGVVLPLGKHGVLVAGCTDAGAFDESAVKPAKVLVATTRAALDRADHEETIREREETLQRQNEQLERLNRINSVIREIDQTLVRATTREEVERAVCDRLANADPYRFVWIGEHDPVDESITPRAWAGVEDGYLDAIMATVEEPSSGAGLARRAVHTRESQATNDIHTDPLYEPWREAALSRGYQSSIAVPITYGDTVYGVLTVYAERPGVFDEMERAVVEELGETIAYAINAAETKRALLSDAVVELDVRIRNADTLLPRLARETGGRITFDGGIPRSDDGSTTFFTASGAPTEEILDVAGEFVAVERIRHVADRDGEHRFEATITGPTIARTLAEYGAVIETIAVEGEETRVVVELPRTADVRGFVDVLQSTYDDANLVARRDRDRTAERHAPAATFEDELTEKQRDALRTAYLGGYFEWPRESTGEEIAESLGVSRPTFDRHARMGQRALLDLLFDGD